MGGLLYEPGNWGDALKASWLATLLRWVADRSSGGFSGYLDPFAGAPTYPLGAQTAKRFEALRSDTLAFLHTPFIEQGLWPSAATIFRELSSSPMTVYDADRERREAWRGSPGVAIAEAASGWNALESAVGDENRLTLVDPYDILAEWRGLAESALFRPGLGTTLIYVYNRSAKSAEQFREYRAFRAFLDDTTGVRYLAGRVGCDPFLPNSHHEMILLPGRTIESGRDFEQIADRLEAATLELDAAMGRMAVFWR
ncbi:MAG: hypothetical protein LBJ46_10055 [Planctomycetota bacterium]|nr:hypothetical protein [Planctomycetota bacterium]